MMGEDEPLGEPPVSEIPPPTTNTKADFPVRSQTPTQGGFTSSNIHATSECGTSDLVSILEAGDSQPFLKLFFCIIVVVGYMTVVVTFWIFATVSDGEFSV